MASQLCRNMMRAFYCNYAVVQLQNINFILQPTVAKTTLLFMQFILYCMTMISICTLANCIKH